MFWISIIRVAWLLISVICQLFTCGTQTGSMQSYFGFLSVWNLRTLAGQSLGGSLRNHCPLLGEHTWVSTGELRIPCLRETFGVADSCIAPCPLPPHLGSCRSKQRKVWVWVWIPWHEKVVSQSHLHAGLKHEESKKKQVFLLSPDFSVAAVG